MYMDLGHLLYYLYFFSLCFMFPFSPFSLANILWITEKATEFQKNIYFCFTDYTKAFDCGSQQTVENSSRDKNTRPPCPPPEKPVFRSSSNSQNWTQNIRLVQNWERSTSRLYMSPYLFNLYAEYIMQNTRLGDS